MKIYVHRNGHHDAHAVEADPSVPIVQALDVAPEDYVALEDADEPLDASLTLEAAGIADRAHVFVGRRRRIEVTVSFNGERREREFGPSRRVEQVFRWATGKHAFDLGREDAAEHTLALAETGTIPPEDTHLGSLDDSTPGRVAFTLIPKHRYEG